MRLDELRRVQARIQDEIRRGVIRQEREFTQDEKDRVLDAMREFRPMAEHEPESRKTRAEMWEAAGVTMQQQRNLRRGYLPQEMLEAEGAVAVEGSSSQPQQQPSQRARGGSPTGGPDDASRSAPARIVTLRGPDRSGPDSIVRP